MTLPKIAVTTSLACLSLLTTQAEEPLQWKKHLIVEGGRCNTAVAVEANGDGLMDVVASYMGKVSLFTAPDWQEHVIYRFMGGGHGGCIHSEALDVDDDGDLDWAGTLAHDHPFWLENPGADRYAEGAWVPRMIDHDITGIHCITKADIDNDGKDDLIINNFQPDKGLGDSMAWFKIPNNPLRAKQWQRHIFADGDARGGSHYMGAGDIDGDGWKEIAVGAKGAPFEDGNWFAFWKNPGKQGVGGAWEKVILAENQLAATNILPCDVNGDGKLDWLASRGHSKGILWFENPTWKLHDIDTEILCPHSLTVADIDGDGDSDAASCGYESKWLRWYENDGKGSFTIHTIDDAQASYDLRSLDMDGDGDLDLLNAGQGSNNVVWYENLGR